MTPHYDEMPDGSFVLADPRAEIQGRMGIQPIQELTTERATLVRQNAKRTALYSSSGTWKTRRDMLMAMIALEIRGKLTRDGEKATDSVVSAHVLTDARFKAFIDASEDEMAQFAISSDAIQGIDDTLLRDVAISRFLASEMRNLG